MRDIVFLLGTIVFFVLGLAYLKGCDRLRPEK